MIILMQMMKELQIKYGGDFNEGRTNISIMFDYYDRDAIAASEDPRWGDSDHRKWIPADSFGQMIVHSIIGILENGLS